MGSPLFSPKSWLLEPDRAMVRLAPEHFADLCAQNPELRLELTKNGELMVMAPTGGETGERNGELFGQLYVWNRAAKLGRVFDSSTGYDFTAIGGGKLSPDVSWIAGSRLVGVAIEGFIPVVPDFVIELRSRSDRLGDLQQKMAEYRRLGVKLGLLVNPGDRQVEIYRPGQPVELLEAPALVAGGEVLPGFQIDMALVW
jgi:Uma2 family endonuclease